MYVIVVSFVFFTGVSEVHFQCKFQSDLLRFRIVARAAFKTLQHITIFLGQYPDQFAVSVKILMFKQKIFYILLTFVVPFFNYFSVLIRFPSFCVITLLRLV